MTGLLMTREFDFGGVLLSSVLVSAVLALVASAVLARLLSWAGFYRLVWHRALFDAALFVILWALIVSAPSFRS